MSLLAGLLLLGACGAGAEGRRDPFTASGEVIAMSGGDGGARNACFTCHALGGSGDDQTPRLAGLHVGYLQKQLEDYAAERRADPVMSPIARKLDAEARRRVAAYYASLPSKPVMARGLSGGGAAERLYHQGDPGRGLQACADCHGAAGQGLGAANPEIARQPAVYLADQLTRWREARRRNDPRGVMMSISRRLTSGEIAGLAAYIATLPGSSAPDDLSPEASPPERRDDG